MKKKNSVNGMENFLHLRGISVRVWEHIFYRMICVACALNHDAIGIYLKWCLIEYSTRIRRYCLGSFVRTRFTTDKMLFIHIASVFVSTC